MKSALTILLAAWLVAPALAAPTEAPAAAPAAPDPAKGQALSTAVCAACHAADGSRGSPTYPIIAGQHPHYLVKQLTEFKSGQRPSPIMKGIAAALSEADMRDAAAFYASKQAKPGFAKHRESVALGESIWRGGIAAKQVPACAGCHSPDGAGIPIQYPRLGGQHADYAGTQLRNFRSGARNNSEPMSAIAARLSDAEIDAVADFVAGLH